MGMLGLVLATTLAGTPAAVSVDEDSVANTARRAWMQQLAANLRTSSSSRERALSTLVWDVGSNRDAAEYTRRGKLLREAAAAAPGDRLVQSLWARADDDASGCGPAHPCLEREMAWAHLEPDNSASWLPVLEKADRDRDEKLRDAALAGISKADRHDGLFAESADAWLTVFERYPLPDQVRRLEEQEMVSGVGAGPEPSTHAVEMALAVSFSGMPLVPPAWVYQHCRVGRSELKQAVPPQACAHLGQLMAVGPSLLDRAVGPAFLYGADDPRRIELRRQLDWIRWQATPMPYGNSPADPSDDIYIADLRSTGSEMRALELLLQRRGLPLTPPAAWQRPEIPAMPAEEH